MELALSSTNQLLRRAGKRLMKTKLSNPTQSHQNEKNDVKVESRRLQLYSKTDHQWHGKSLLLNGDKKMGIKSLQQYDRPFNLLSKVTSFTNILYSQSRNLHTISKANWVSQSEIEDTLIQSNMQFKRRHTGIITDCTACCSSKSLGDDNFKLFIDTKTGDNICRSCGLSQSWLEFKKKLHDLNVSNDIEKKAVEYTLEQSDVQVDELWSKSSALTSHDVLLIQKVFPEAPSLDYKTLQHFNIRKHNETLLLPFYDITKKNIIALKVYSHSPRLVQTISKTNQPANLFGWSTLLNTADTLILTSNELDSLCISQATGLPTMSLPQNASTLPPECLPYLEQFNEIQLCFPDEYQATQNLQRFAAKLGLSRCYRIISQEKICNLLSTDDGIRTVLEKKLPLSHNEIITFKELRNEVLNDLMNAKRNAGVPFIRFPSLNDYLKGHRRGEMTVFTGPTGSGKTTFLSELSIDLCMQGVRTLWGSFEIKNNRLANTMMHQFSGIKLENHIENFTHWCEEFENLPMYFMNYYGATDFKQVLETIQYAVYTYDIEHVIIDNLQFMTMVDRGEDKFQLMDRAISSFRRCASDLNIHITVVVHPRKENDGASLQTASIYGSAKASQEADNVLILQNSENLAMQVSKNRYSGAVGTIPLCFHPDSLCLSGFHRNVDSNEAILPMLKVKRPVQNIKVVQNKKSSKSF